MKIYLKSAQLKFSKFSGDTGQPGPPHWGADTGVDPGSASHICWWV